MGFGRGKTLSSAMIGFSVIGLVVLSGCDLGFFSATRKNDSQNTTVQQGSSGNNLNPLPPPVALDPSFGNQGKLVTALGPRWDRIRSLGLQSDGHIVAGGSTVPDLAVSKHRLFALVRYDFQGGLDRAFGNPSGTLGSGVVTTAIGTGDAEAMAVIVLSDNSLLLAGSARSGANNAANSNFALMHYSSSGIPDNSGPVMLDFGSQKDDVVNAAALDSKGRVVLAGSTVDARGHQVFALARFNTKPSLALDTSFGTNGMVTTSFQLGKNQVAQAVALQPDGKIVVVGYVNTGTNTDFAIARYLVDGQHDGRLDPAFGNGGLVVTDFGSSLDDAASAVVVQPDLEILVAGYTNNGSNTDLALARYDSSGRPDIGFGANGRVTTDFGGDDYAKSLLISASGRWMMASGYALSGNYYQFAVARYNWTGQLDTSFANNGKFLSGFGSNQNSYGYASLFLPDGGMLFGGEAYQGVNQFDFALLKLK